MEAARIRAASSMVSFEKVNVPHPYLLSPRPRGTRYVNVQYEYVLHTTYNTRVLVLVIVEFFSSDPWSPDILPIADHLDWHSSSRWRRQQARWWRRLAEGRARASKLAARAVPPSGDALHSRGG